jgi:hypothetical protein
MHCFAYSSRKRSVCCSLKKCCIGTQIAFKTATNTLEMFGEALAARDAYLDVTNVVFCLRTSALGRNDGILLGR